MRRTPYTTKGIRRMRCIRGCGRPGEYQWQICADRNVWRVLCAEHDVELNEMVMRWAFGDKREADIADYRKKVLG